MPVNPVLAVDGFEAGALLSVYYASAASASIQTTTIRNGKYAARVNPSASRGGFFLGTPAGTNHAIARFYTWFGTLPDADVPIWYRPRSSGGVLNAGLAYNSATGCLRPFLNDAGSGTTFGSDGPTVSTGAWIRIDMLLKVNSAGTSSSTIDWKQAGAAQSQLSATVSGGTQAGMVFGNLQGSTIMTSTNTCTMDVFFDDVVLLGDDGTYDIQYPLGDGRVLPSYPVGEGTHSGAGSFIDNSSNSPPVNPHLLVDDDPHSTNTAADWFGQNTVGANDYLEFLLGDLPAFGGNVQGWSLYTERNAISAGTGNCFWKGYDGSVFAIFNPTVTHTTMDGRIAVGAAGGGSRWTRSSYNGGGVRLRLGYAGQVSLVDRIHAFLMQVAVAGAPRAGWGIIV